MTVKSTVATHVGFQLPRLSTETCPSQERNKRINDRHFKKPQKKTLLQWTVLAAYSNIHRYFSWVLLIDWFSDCDRAIQNLQSSLNDEGGRGVISLSCLYAAWIVSGMLTPAAIRLFTAKG